MCPLSTPSLPAPGTGTQQLHQAVTSHRPPAMTRCPGTSARCSHSRRCGEGYGALIEADCCCRPPLLLLHKTFCTLWCLHPSFLSLHLCPPPSVPPPLGALKRRRVPLRLSRAARLQRALRNVAVGGSGLRLGPCTAGATGSPGGREARGGCCPAAPTTAAGAQAAAAIGHRIHQAPRSAFLQCAIPR